MLNLASLFFGVIFGNMKNIYKEFFNHRMTVIYCLTELKTLFRKNYIAVRLVRNKTLLF